MKNFIFLTGVIFGFAVATIGCSKSSSNNAGVAANSCGYGQVSVANYGCLQQCATDPNAGFYPPTGQCLPGQTTGGTYNPYINDTTGATWQGQYVITNVGLYQSFLNEYAGLCHIYKDWLGSSNTCKDFTSGGWALLSLASRALPASGFATLNIQSSYSYGYFGTQSPVTLSGGFNAIDNNTGFILEGMGWPGTPSYNAVIQVKVSGKPTTNALTVQFLYRGGQFAQANVSR